MAREVWQVVLVCTGLRMELSLREGLQRTPGSVLRPNGENLGNGGSWLWLETWGGGRTRMVKCAVGKGQTGVNGSRTGGTGTSSRPLRI